MGAEGLLLTALALIAGVLLVAGLAQAFHTPARRRLRQGGIRYRTRTAARSGRATARRPEPGTELQLSLRRASSPEDEPGLPPAPGVGPAPPERGDAGLRRGDLTERAEAPLDETRRAGLDLEPGAPGDAAPEPSTPESVTAGAAAPLPLEECLTLYQAGQLDGVVALAEPPLQAAAETEGGPARSAERSALWSLVGLARQALDDGEAARAALQEAFLAAPEADRPTYLGYLAALGETDEEARLGPLRREVLWVAYGHAAEMLVQRQEFLRVRRLVWEALADAELPDARRAALKEILSTAYAREIEQLTAASIAAFRGTGDVEALDSLRRADGLLASIPDETLTPERDAEVRRSLWEGYRTLGVHRMEAGEVESGLELLLRALALASPDSESQRQTREALVRAVEAAVDGRAEQLGRLLKDGKRAAALAESERLLAMIREAMDAGLSDAEVGVPLAKARRALQQVLPG
ncbi:MAG: hypothetical protein HY726_07825 [Candidatus Rokubacteria bacterium]|nr:hypothetical protein [Candidatus Rokubacteria bacterium]